MTGFIAGQLALVTGAAGDIGRAVAIRLASGGVSVILADHPAAGGRLEESLALCDRVLSPGCHAAARSFDVTDVPSAASTIASLADDVGTPDLLFNNAGYQGEFANTIDASIDDWRSVFDVNVTGAFVVLQAVAQGLRTEGRPGAIVNAGSMAGVSGAPNMAAYSASKAAVIAMTKSAAKDLAPSGIRVNAVSPAFIGPGTMWDKQVRGQAELASPYYADSEAAVTEQMIGQIPLRRVGRLDEVASSVAFLLSEDASYLTGVNLEVSGGAA